MVVDDCSCTSIKEPLVCMCVEITGYLNIWQCCSLMLFSPWVEAERMWAGELRRQIRRLMAVLPARLISVQLIQARRKTSYWFSRVFFFMCSLFSSHWEASICRPWVTGRRLAKTELFVVSICLGIDFSTPFLAGWWVGSCCVCFLYSMRCSTGSFFSHRALL